MNWEELKERLIKSKHYYFHTENGVLLCGDCLEVMKEFPEKIFDAIITDPPYGTTACKWDVVIPFEDMWKELKRIRKDRTAIVLFGTEPFSSLLRVSNLKEYKYDWIWNKNTTSSFALAKKQPLRNHEIISVFYKKQCVFNPIKEPRDLNEKSKQRMKYEFSSTKGKNVLQGGIKKVKFIPEDKDLSYPKTVKYFPTVPNNSKERYHPTQKPLALLEYLVKTYTNEGDLVLDFTCGSGTTLVACEKLNRRWIGIEINPKYCEIAKQRILKCLRGIMNV